MGKVAKMVKKLSIIHSNPKLDEFVPGFSDQEIVEIIDGFEDPGRADSALMIKLYTTTHTTQYTIHTTQYTMYKTQRNQYTIHNA